jgi:hypothetical protein
MKARAIAIALLTLTLASGASAPRAWAAACCGGSSAAPALITGDDRAQVSVTVSQGRVIGDAPPDGLPVFRANGDDEFTRLVRLEAATLITDRWQAGLGVPVVQKSTEKSGSSGRSAAGLGDLALSVGYEALPEWDYSPWRPRGYVFTQLTLPTGGSVYDGAGWDARGRGFATWGIGALLLKGWGDWDATLIGEVHRSFARDIDDGAASIHPGWGGSGSLGGGYSLRAFPLRLGVSLGPIYEGPIAVSVGRDSSSQLAWSASAQLAWLVTTDLSLSAVYTDQTLVGPASNSQLSRTLGLLLQKRWQR